MYLNQFKLKKHPILGDINLSLINSKTNEAYSIVAFVGENGCGKTTILNEIFNYDESKYICDKQGQLNALYLRQGSLHKNAMKEVRKLIDGEDMYPINSKTYAREAGPYSLRSNNAINRIDKGVELLKTLGDNDITEIFQENHILEVYCSTDVSKRIDGKEHGYNITNYSSGQQEILLKLKDLKSMASGTDVVLLDEPETSLHPRWQIEIVHLIESMLEAGDMVPQIFLATHSEKVLESLILRDDVLIVRLYKDGKDIKSESISDMDLRLPSPTFAELDYVVFHIPSLGYHDELFNYFAYLIDKNSTVAVDEKILFYGNKLFKDEMKKYEKTRVYKVNKYVITTNTLPTYIRDFFHHPNEMKPPTDSELELSITCLRELVKYLVKRGFDNKV